MAETLKVMVSSTSLDLPEHRTKIRDACLQQDTLPLMMENLPALDAEAIQVSIGLVNQADIYVGIFAFRYGYVPKSSEISITEMEYNRAVERGIPRLIFIMDKDHPLTAAGVETGPGAAKLIQLKARLDQERVRNTFKSADELKAQVINSLSHQRRVLEHGTGAVMTGLNIDLEAIRETFINHMHRFAGTQTPEQALERYFALRLQSNQPIQRPQQKGEVSELPVGIWPDLVRHPITMVLCGTAGSGKTTQLLHEAYLQAGMAAKNEANSRLPVYIPVSMFTGGDASNLLDLAERWSRSDGDALEAAWRAREKPVCLLLDGIDEVLPQYQFDLRTAITSLARSGAGFHSLIAACRPGPDQDALAAEWLRQKVDFTTLFILPLNDAEIDAFLRRYESKKLIPLLDERLRETVQTVDLLSALAQSAEKLDIHSLPSTAGQIYRLLVDEYLAPGKQASYDYLRVQRPVLAEIAFRMQCLGQGFLPLDEEFYDFIVAQLQEIEHFHHHHKRRCLPDHWNVDDFIEELVSADHPLVLTHPGNPVQLSFCKRGYQDYFVAVHLLLKGVNSPSVQQAIPSLKLGDWIQPTILLLGLDPAAGDFFDRLYARDPGLAVQMWFENRPAGIAGPPLLSQLYTSQAAQQATWRLRGFDEPITHQLLAARLVHEDPGEQLQAVAAFSQWGMPAAERLLQAAEANHPLVQAAAHYALIHLSEPHPDNAIEQPVPPLIQMKEEGFTYSSWGAGRLQVGPLRLLQVPQASAVSLNIDIHHLLLDLFKQETSYTFLPTPPALLAAVLIEGSQTIDWLGLTALFRRIGRDSTECWQIARRREALKKLSAFLFERASAYTAFGETLARELGLPVEAVQGLEMNEQIYGHAQRGCNQLRRLYSLKNQVVQPAPKSQEALQRWARQLQSIYQKIPANLTQQIDPQGKLDRAFRNLAQDDSLLPEYTAMMQEMVLKLQNLSAGSPFLSGIINKLIGGIIPLDAIGNITIKNVVDGGYVYAVKVAGMQPANPADPADPSQDAQPKRLISASFNLDVDNILGGSVIGLCVDRLTGGDDLLPLQHRIVGNMSIDQISAGSVGGVIVQKFVSGHPDWRLWINLSIDRMLGGELKGVVCE